LFLLAFIVSMVLFLSKGPFRILGGILGAISILFMVNYHPLQSSRFDSYRGNQGTAPYQEVIDYVKDQGGLVFWAHPESNYATAGIPFGPITMKTPHYPDALLSSNNYTGFSAIYGDTIKATEPGAHWDKLLLEYCSGKRKTPVWGIAGADYHGDANGVELDSFQTVFFLEKKTTANVLDALKKGLFYAVQKGKKEKLSIHQLQLENVTTQSTAISGELLYTDGPPVISGYVTASDDHQHPVTVTVIRGGQIIRTIKGDTPLKFRVMDMEKVGGKTFYRLDVRSDDVGYLLTNPIFVSRAATS